MQKLTDFKDNPEAIEKARKDYKYQPKLTERLLQHEGDFSDINLLEIALWKVNRYTDIAELTDALNDLRRVYSEEKAREVLRMMLHPDRQGFQLPMASTFLKFAVPKYCAIIDQRAYRILMEEDCLKPKGDVESQVELYFKYLKRLRETVAQYGISFEEADRVLYQLDKTHNHDHKI